MHRLRAIYPVADEHVENLFQGIKEIVLPPVKLVQVHEQALPLAVEAVIEKVPPHRDIGKRLFISGFKAWQQSVQGISSSFPAPLWPIHATSFYTPDEDDRSCMLPAIKRFSNGVEAVFVGCEK